jgi:tetratricopeptide (TPR) repeat protein
VGEAYPLVVAHARLGITLFYLGEVTRAQEHLEQAVRLYDPAEHRSLAAVWGQDWGIMARVILANVLLRLGYPDRAQRMHRETVELAREGDPFTLSAALCAIPSYLHGKRAAEHIEECVAIAGERGYALQLALATILRGHLRGGSRGLEEIQKGAGQLAGPQLATFLKYGQMQLAEAYWGLGRSEDALAALEAAFASASENRVEDVSLQRLRGEILLQRNSAEEAERCLRRALEIAREQEMKSDELRAATSLARLLRDRGRSDEARALLQPVYDWFTEGFDTQDLKEAKALLQKMG